jgi:hypothetical protein
LLARRVDQIIHANMAHDVFISYAATDKAVADAVCAQLESVHKVQCWIAPRDLAPGISSSEARVSALDRSKIMVLILSGPQNASPQVEREVERAVQQGINVVPMRIDKAMSAETLEYAPTGGIRSAGAGSLAALICHLAESVRALLDQLPAGVRPATPAEAPEAGSKWAWLIPAVFGVAIIVAVIVVGLPLFEIPKLRVADTVGETGAAKPALTPASDAVDPALASQAMRTPIQPVGSTSPGVRSAADATSAAGAAPASASPQAEKPAAAAEALASGRAGTEPSLGTPGSKAVPDRVGVAPRVADAAPPSIPAEAATAAAAGLAPLGTLLIDFINTFPDGSVEVEVDGRKQWSRRLKLTASTGALSRLRLQRASEQLGSELKVPVGDHRITVTMLNADGEVRDSETTSLHVDASRSVTLRIRVTRFRNRLQLESVAG